MPRPPTLLACALLILSLGACARQQDDFKPRIVITEPAAGSVSRASDTVVRGYVIDDIGVAKVQVDDTTLPTQGSRRIASFGFKTKVSGARAKYTIRATDVSGLSTTLELPLRFDGEAPTFKISKFERQGKTIRITGTASDNTKVVYVGVDGNRIAINPGRAVSFYAETTGIWADLEVRDAAGNVTKQRLR